MSDGSILSNEEFQCPLCLVNNRAGAKFCRKCGRPRDVLAQYVEPNVAAPANTLSSSPALTSTPTASAETSASALDNVEPGAHTNPECSGCSSIVRASDRFCCWCGESQPIRNVRAHRGCPMCSQILSARANYCFQCGHDVAERDKLRMRVPADLFVEESSEFFPTFEA
jgi:hypothetical protein